mmetsp:Transcript_43247/g.112312  ORF Transcript_43247/g.112312 Transcript_43247/m.112312 type:complete len:203 (+) Transcript_43247:2871-3479(+)
MYVCVKENGHASLSHSSPCSLCILDTSSSSKHIAPRIPERRLVANCTFVTLELQDRSGIKVKNGTQFLPNSEAKRVRSIVKPDAQCILHLSRRKNNTGDRWLLKLLRHNADHQLFPQLGQSRAALVSELQDPATALREVFPHGLRLACITTEDVDVCIFCHICSLAYVQPQLPKLFERLKACYFFNGISIAALGSSRLWQTP